MSLYRLEQVRRSFGGRPVLDLPALELEEGRCCALIGPNGAGKTTLLRLLAFLEAPSAGEIFFRGQAVGREKARLLALRRQVVLVEQFPIMFTASVWKNVEFGLKLRRVPKPRRAAAVRRALETVGLGDLAAAAAHRLSGGETQRVALARALALSPKVLLLDEPTANLDAENRQAVLELLGRLAADRRMTVVFSTHDRLLAAALAGRLLALDAGRLAPGAAVNLFAGTLAAGPGGRAQVSVGGALRLPLSAEVPAPDSPQRVRFFVEPAALAFCDPQPATGPPPEAVGRLVAVSAETGGVRLVVDAGVRLSLLLAPADYRRRPPAVGDMVGVRIPPPAVRLL